MDKGAHFKKSDFQVHTPRDTNWNGPRPSTEEERRAFAERFIRACRARNLQAVAITDHHDLAYFPVIKNAAQNELDTEGVPISESDKISVFPGIELTLGVPCQAILIMDTNFPEEQLPNVLALLGITTNSLDEPVHAPTTRLDRFRSIKELCELLDSADYLRGRYVLLPNVSDGGNATILRSGFASAYKEMPCVGGYVDGSVDSLGQGNQRIINGEDLNYGSKSLGVIQTSDSRSDDFAELGVHSSWIKWTEPTAEALRQACLAKKSRIQQATPNLPSIFINRIQVSDSSFLGPLDIHLNKQFNSLIGGRGTGKTSVLEYIRYSMQDQPVRAEAENNDTIGDKRSRILETVTKIGATVTVSWIKNNVPHIVTFGGGHRMPIIKIGSAEQVEIPPDELRSLLPIQAYSQKQLSTVGTREGELRRFIEQPIQDQLDECSDQIKSERDDLVTLYDRVLNLHTVRRKISAIKTEQSSIHEQVQVAEKELPDLEEELGKALKENPQRLQEKQAITAAQSDFNKAGELIEVSLTSMENLPRPITLEEGSPQSEIVLTLHGEIERIIATARESISGVKDDLMKEEAKTTALIEKWTRGQREHEALYEAAAERAAEHRQRLDLIKQLRERESILQGELKELEIEELELRSDEEEFNKGWEQWVSVHEKRGDILEAACVDLTRKSNEEINAQLRRGADYEKALDKLRGLLEGCRIRENNWSDLRDYLNEDPVGRWMNLMASIKNLVEMKLEDITTGDDPPEIANWALTPNVRRNIIERTDSPRIWLEVALTSLADKPEFYYKSDPSADEIPFKDASAGQQATALLKVLLKEDTGPLLIDQPEDDLDNATILEIAEELWEAKQHRQIIFSSHNANIVVNGDAELVIHCDYAEGEGRTRGSISKEGAIDVPAIRIAIQNVIEGGKRAFLLRQQKYGF